MILKRIIIFTGSILILFSLLTPIRIQASSNIESIVKYSSEIKVNKDNSIDVTEKILYDTGSNYKHGIYRDIYPYSSQKKRMNISGVSVLDEFNTPYKFEILKSGKNIRIKIGDPDVTFNGQKIYIIKYHTTMAVGQYDDFDEIYWNVTGNSWTMPIQSVDVSVMLPDGAKSYKNACYYGLFGENNSCNVLSENTFTSIRSLNVGEGLTVAVGFPKGNVSKYTKLQLIYSILVNLKEWLITIIIVFLAFFFSVKYWWKNGRDERKTGVIVPQYDVYDNLTPMQVAGIVNEKIDAKLISSEIIYLAVNGYLKIKHSTERKTDYEFIRLKDLSDISNDFDKEIFLGLFGQYSRRSLNLDNLIKDFKNKKVDFENLNFEDFGIDPDSELKESVKISELKNKFYKVSSSSIKKTADSLLENGYYKNLGKIKSLWSLGVGLLISIFISIWAGAFLGAIIGGAILQKDYLILPIGIGIFLAFNIVNIFYNFSPAKTIKGVEAKERLLGLKMYLQIAEKDRLEFHNAPAKTPEIFEKMLPYAIAMGVSDIWIKEFEDLNDINTDWYEGPHHTSLSAMALGNAMNGFYSSAGSSMYRAPSSGGGSGSGGGGSSGGGGGGGGGGSW